MVKPIYIKVQLIIKINFFKYGVIQYIMIVFWISKIRIMDLSILKMKFIILYQLIVQIHSYELVKMFSIKFN